MNHNLPVFKNIEITKNKGTYLTFTNSSMLITGDYLIIITDDFSDENYFTNHVVINLSEIKSYKTK